MIGASQGDQMSEGAMGREVKRNTYWVLVVRSGVIGPLKSLGTMG